MAHAILRREALGILGAGAFAFAQAMAADAALRFTALDHVEFLVSDVEKSAAFYARVFGNTVLKNNKTTRRYVKLGPSYIAMDRNAQGAIRVDHFCAGIPGFQVASVHSYLDGKGIAYRDFPSGKDLAVRRSGRHQAPACDRQRLGAIAGRHCLTGNDFDRRRADFSSHRDRSYFAERDGSRKIGGVLREDSGSGDAAQQQPDLVPGRNRANRAAEDAGRRERPE